VKCPYAFTITNKKGKKELYERIEYTDKIASGKTVPCGKCIICRKNRSHEWAIRCIHEARYHKDNCFITLTYDEQNVPMTDKGILTLKKADLQKFFKRFRKEYSETKIKYLACGEYGERTYRPHYHILLFGWKPKQTLEKIVNGQKIFISDEIQELWKLGFTEVATMTEGRIYYATGYLLKKFAKEMLNGRNPEFNVASKGIGYQYAIDNRIDVENFKLKERGKIIPTPRYYLKKIKAKKEIQMRNKIQKEIQTKRNLRLSGESLLLKIKRSRTQALKDVEAASGVEKRRATRKI